MNKFTDILEKFVVVALATIMTCATVAVVYKTYMFLMT